MTIHEISPLISPGPNFQIRVSQMESRVRVILSKSSIVSILSLVLKLVFSLIFSITRDSKRIGNYTNCSVALFPQMSISPLKKERKKNARKKIKRKSHCIEIFSRLVKNFLILID